MVKTGKLDGLCTFHYVLSQEEYKKAGLIQSGFFYFIPLGLNYLISNIFLTELNDPATIL